LAQSVAIVNIDMGTINVSPTAPTAIQIWRDKIYGSCMFYDVQ